MKITTVIGARPQFVKAATARQNDVLITGLDFSGLQKFRNDVSFRIRGVSKVMSRGQSGRAAKIEVYFAGKSELGVSELVEKFLLSGKRDRSSLIKEIVKN